MYNNHITKEEVVSFSRLVINARFTHPQNIRLAFLLTKLDHLSIAAASRALDVERAIIMYRMLPNNPCFVTELKKINTWGHGGKERRIRLSDEAHAQKELIISLAENLIPQDERTVLEQRVHRALGEQVHKTIKKIDPFKLLRESHGTPSYKYTLKFLASQLEMTVPKLRETFEASLKTQKQEAR